MLFIGRASEGGGEGDGREIGRVGGGLGRFGGGGGGGEGGGSVRGRAHVVLADKTLDRNMPQFCLYSQTNHALCKCQ